MLSLFKRRRAAFSDGEVELVLADCEVTDWRSGVQESYIYDICLKGRRGDVGYISLRLGDSPALYYLGHVGYRVEKPYRGHGYAWKALELLKPLMLREGMLHPVVTTDVDNWASRRTALKAGCQLERIVPVPPRYRDLCMGSTHKCRYVLSLPPCEEAPL